MPAPSLAGRHAIVTGGGSGLGARWPGRPSLRCESRRPGQVDAAYLPVPVTGLPAGGWPEPGEQVVLGYRCAGRVAGPDEAFAAESLRRDLGRDLAEPGLADLAGV